MLMAIAVELIDHGCSYGVAEALRQGMCENDEAFHPLILTRQSQTQNAKCNRILKDWSSTSRTDAVLRRVGKAASERERAQTPRARHASQEVGTARDAP